MKGKILKINVESIFIYILVCITFNINSFLLKSEKTNGIDEDSLGNLFDKCSAENIYTLYGMFQKDQVHIDTLNSFIKLKVKGNNECYFKIADILHEIPSLHCDKESEEIKKIEKLGNLSDIETFNALRYVLFKYLFEVGKLYQPDKISIGGLKVLNIPENKVKTKAIKRHKKLANTNFDEKVTIYFYERWTNGIKNYIKDFYINAYNKFNLEQSNKFTPEWNEYFVNTNPSMSSNFNEIIIDNEKKLLSKYIEKSKSLINKYKPNIFLSIRKLWVSEPNFDQRILLDYSFLEYFWNIYVKNTLLYVAKSYMRKMVFSFIYKYLKLIFNKLM